MREPPCCAWGCPLVNSRNGESAVPTRRHAPPKTLRHVAGDVVKRQRREAPRNRLDQ